MKLELLSRKYVRSVDHAQPLAQINVEDLAKVSAGFVCVYQVGEYKVYCGSYANN